MVENGELCVTVYHLCSDTITSHAIEADFRTVMDAMILWHKQLGHINEKCLKTMHD